MSRPHALADHSAAVLCSRACIRSRNWPMAAFLICDTGCDIKDRRDFIDVKLFDIIELQYQGRAFGQILQRALQQGLELDMFDLILGGRPMITKKQRVIGINLVERLKLIGLKAVFPVLEFLGRKFE